MWFIRFSGSIAFVIRKNSVNLVTRLDVGNKSNDRRTYGMSRVNVCYFSIEWDGIENLHMLFVCEPPLMKLSFFLKFFSKNENLDRLHPLRLSLSLIMDVILLCLYGWNI